MNAALIGAVVWTLAAAGTGGPAAAGPATAQPGPADAVREASAPPGRVPGAGATVPARPAPAAPPDAPPAPRRAQQEGDSLLTLAEAIDIALADNHRLGVADAAVDVAEADVLEARAARLPTLELWETFQRTTNPVFVFGNLLRQESFGPENFAIELLNTPDPLNNFTSTVTVEWPVWTAGRIGNGVAAAGHARDAVRSDGERTRQEVIQQVVEAYSGAVLARSHGEVARAARDTARAHVELAESLARGGIAVESDVLSARVRESEVEEMVIRAEAAVAVADAALNLSLGRDLATPVGLPDDLELDGPDREPLDALLAEALEARPDLRAGGQRRSAAERAADAARGATLPEVGLTAFAEANSEDLVDDYGFNWSLMIAARWTFFDGGARDAAVARERARVRQAERGLDLLRQAVGLEVRRAWHELRAAEQRVSQAGQAVELAQESLRIVENRYREGLATLVELLDAETALTRARTRVVGARRDVLVGRAALDLAVGRR